MQFCQIHWQALRDAIDARGLAHMIAPDGATARKRLQAEKDGTATDETFEPLLAAHNMIGSAALNLIGSYIFTGPYCPLCEVEKIFGRTNFINDVSDIVLQYCRDKKLVPTVQ